MSTALVTPYFDMNDVIYQNLLNNAISQRSQQLNMSNRAVGSPVGTPSPIRSRNSSGDSSSLCSSTSPVCSRKMEAAKHLMISAVQQDSQQGPPGHARKLDRSVSEPADRQMQQQKNVNSTRYKTELCRPFEENGYCKYGDKCQFAHGHHELRSLSRHPKYKTELCRTYHTIGFCPYGPRCHFIHNDEDKKLGQHEVTQQVVAAAVQQVQQQRQQQQHRLHQHHTPPPTSAQQVPLQVQYTGAPIHHAMSVGRSQPMSMQQVQRPKMLNFSLSMPATSLPLGSTVDSPPPSITDSPSMSPTSSFFGDDLYSLGGQTPPVEMMNVGFTTPPPAVTPCAFNFQRQDMTPPPAPMHFMPQSASMPVPGKATPPNPLMTPLNVHTADPLASLAAGLHAATLNNQQNNNVITAELLRDCLGDIFAPPTPPDSSDSMTSVTTTSCPPPPPPACESPVEANRGLRLPIFSQISADDC